MHVDPYEDEPETRREDTAVEKGQRTWSIATDTLRAAYPQAIRDKIHPEPPKASMASKGLEPKP